MTEIFKSDSSWLFGCRKTHNKNRTITVNKGKFFLGKNSIALTKKKKKEKKIQLMKIEKCQKSVLCFLKKKQKQEFDETCMKEQKHWELIILSN